MSSDTPSGESGALTVDGAAAEWANLIDPPQQDEPQQVDTEIDTADKPAESEPEPNAQEEGADAPLTIEVDGKPVTLTKEQIAEAYKSGLRQSDYTKKTMEAADARKAAEAEIQKTQQERATYAQSLTKMEAQLEGAIEDQSKIDWQTLLNTDPVEYLRQQHLFQQRQAALAKNKEEQQKVQHQMKSEAENAKLGRLQQEQQELLAKLPEWKDSSKATAEQKAIRAHLQERGYTDAELDIQDHRAVLLARDAMLYRQMMSKAQAAAKKVSTLPTKVERPGVSTDRSSLDGRTAAMQRLSKSGSIDDAARVFASLL